MRTEISVGRNEGGIYWGRGDPAVFFLSPCQDRTDVRGDSRVSLGMFKNQLHSPNLATTSGILVLAPRRVQVPTPPLVAQLNFKHEGSALLNTGDWQSLHMGR